MKVSEYKPRTKSPALTNKFYIRKGKTYKGVTGVSHALQISSKTHSTLPNCVGHVLGCTLEKTGIEFPSMNAQNFWTNGSKYGWKQSSTPQVGAIACYRKSSKLGHVAIVNSVAKNGTITVSASDYGGSRFYTKKIKKPYKWASAGTFQGFLLNPVIEDDETDAEKIERLTQLNNQLSEQVEILNQEIDRCDQALEQVSSDLATAEGKISRAKEDLA